MIFFIKIETICASGGIGRRARLCFHHLGEFIVDYGFPVFIYED